MTEPSENLSNNQANTQLNTQANTQSNSLSKNQTNIPKDTIGFGNQNSTQQQLMKAKLWDAIRTVPDFPKPGIDFYDITPLLLNHIDDVIDAMLGALPTGMLDDVDCLVAIEARGFIFASLLAGRLGKGMMLLRKPGKLPPPVANKSYALEYGSDTLEIQDGMSSKKVLLVDDILATGGTLKTAYHLCLEAGHDVFGVLVLLDLVELHDAFPVPVYSVLEG